MSVSKSKSASIFLAAGIVLGGGLRIASATPTSVPVPNYSFENPSDVGTGFPVGLSAPPWILTGPANIDGFNLPVGGAGTYVQPTEDPNQPVPANGAPYPQGWFPNADESQLAYIIAETTNSLSQAVVDPSTFNPNTFDPSNPSADGTPTNFIAGKQYTLTVALADAEGAPASSTYLRLELYYLDPTTHNPVVVGSADVGSGTLSQQRLTDETVTTGILGAAANGRQINILMVPLENDASGGQFDIDNVRLSYVPEPASLGVLSVAGAGLVLRRRRRAI